MLCFDLYSLFMTATCLLGIVLDHLSKWSANCNKLSSVHYICRPCNYVLTSDGSEMHLRVPNILPHTTCLLCLFLHMRFIYLTMWGLWIIFCTNFGLHSIFSGHWKKKFDATILDQLFLEAKQVGNEAFLNSVRAIVEGDRDFIITTLYYVHDIQIYNWKHISVYQELFLRVGYTRLLLILEGWQAWQHGIWHNTPIDNLIAQHAMPRHWRRKRINGKVDHHVLHLVPSYVSPTHLKMTSFDAQKFFSSCYHWCL